MFEITFVKNLSKNRYYCLAFSMFVVALFTHCYFDMEKIRIGHLCVIGWNWNSNNVTASEFDNLTVKTHKP